MRRGHFLFPLVGPSGADSDAPGPSQPDRPRAPQVDLVWPRERRRDQFLGRAAQHRYPDSASVGAALPGWTDWGGLVADLDWWAHGQVDPAPGADDRDRALPVQWLLARPSVAIRLAGWQARSSSGQTNFGFLGVRVAKTMSEQFGGGRLTDARGSRGEAAIMGKASRWVDYSGPSAPGKIEGICVMDHPSNPNHPTHWHVRGDGWMGASFNRESPYGVARDHSLCLRYRLLVHSGYADPDVL